MYALPQQETFPNNTIAFSTKHVGIYSDAELVRLYKQTSENQFLSPLLERYSEKVFGVAYYYLHDRNDALDASMDTFEVIIKTLGEKDIENFKSWACGICRNICLKRIRDRKITTELTDCCEDFVESDEFEVKYSKNVKKLQSSIEKLKIHQKQCIRAFYLEELTYEQISMRYGYSYKEVKSYIQNGKRKLKILFERKVS